MTLKRLFLPLGLVGALFLGWFLPAPGLFLRDTAAVAGLVAVIFLVNGLVIRLRDLAWDRHLGKTVVVATILALLVSSFVGLGIARLLGLGPQLTLGLVVMATVPPTLSSGIVMTQVSGGNAALAVLLTMLLNLVGIFSVPFVLNLTLAVGGEVPIAPWPLLVKLLLLVALPFAVGKIIRRGGRLESLPAVLNYVPSMCVIMIAYIGLAASRDLLASLGAREFVLIALAALVLHVGLLGLSWVSSRGLGHSPPDTRAFVFVTSQKTLPIGLSVLLALGELGTPAVAVVLGYHLLQLLVDSVLAAQADLAA